MDREIERLIETIGSTGYILGQIEGMDIVAKFCLNRSGIAYQHKQDNEAKMLRDLVDMIRDMSKDARANYDSIYAKERDNAWGGLEELLGGANE